MRVMGLESPDHIDFSSYTVQLNINFTHTCREHACVCTLMACNFAKYREYFDFTRFGSVRSCATVHDNTVEYTLHE